MNPNAEMIKNTRDGNHTGAIFLNPPFWNPWPPLLLLFPFLLRLEWKVQRQALARLCEHHSSLLRRMLWTRLQMIPIASGRNLHRPVDCAHTHQRHSCHLTASCRVSMPFECRRKPVWVETTHTSTVDSDRNRW